MPTIKIYPPRQLPDRNVSEIEFYIWKEELEVYLSQEEDFRHFLDDGSYNSWISSKEYASVDRIVTLANVDENQEDGGDDEAESVRNRKRPQYISIYSC